MDSSAFVALTHRRDQLHSAAEAAFVELTKTRRLVTSNLVMQETATVLRARLGIGESIEFAKALRESALIEVVSISDALEAAAWAMFAQGDDKFYSFTDCSSFAVMRAMKIKIAFAFDRHFAQMGFETIPTRAERNL